MLRIGFFPVAPGSLFRTLALTLALAAISQAAAFADLTGTVLELAPASGDLKDFLGNLVGAALDDHHIDRVVVLEDSATALVLEVAYTGLGGATLHGELLDPGNASLGVETRERLSDSGGRVELRLTPPTGTPDAPARAGFVRLRASLGSVPAPPITAVYRLRRVWTEATSPTAGEATDQVIEIAVRPIGAAAGLSDSVGQSPLPPLRPVPKLILKRSAQVPSGALSRRASQPLMATPQVSAVTTVKPSTLQVAPIGRYKFGLAQKEKDLGAQGPGSDAIELVEAMRLDVALDREDILDVFPLVYRDRNPASGVYYFLPGSYRLAWGADDGFGMRFLYTASSDASAGGVLVALRLNAGVNLTEIALARRLVEGYAARHGLGTVREFRSLPIAGPPSVSLAGDLQHQYQVQSEDVVVNALSDSLAEIEVSFTVDPVTKENLQLALEEEVGLTGRVTLAPFGEALGPQEVPLAVKLAEASTFGRFLWQRDAPWRNRTPYPIELRYLHAMNLDGDVPVIYSWELVGDRVPPGAEARLDTGKIPRFLDSEAARIWLDYRVATDCQSCDREVIGAISGGVSSIPMQQITFRTLSPLADTGAAEIVLHVRSQLFHPKDRTLVEKPYVVINADGQSYMVGPIYVEEGPSKPSTLFEYRLKVVLADGTVHNGERWIPSGELYQPIGRVQVEQAVGTLPDS